MKKVKFVKLHSIQDAILKDCEGLNPDDYEIRDKFVLIEGPKGIIISYDKEGVYKIVKDLSEKYYIEIFKRRTNGGISISPKFNISPPLQSILDYEPDIEEIELRDAVRCFGSRLDTNWEVLLDGCREIGLDLSEYNIERG